MRFKSDWLSINIFLKNRNRKKKAYYLKNKVVFPSGKMEILQPVFMGGGGVNYAGKAAISYIEGLSGDGEQSCISF